MYFCHKKVRGHNCFLCQLFFCPHFFLSVSAPRLMKGFEIMLTGVTKVMLHPTIVITADDIDGS